MIKLRQFGMLLMCSFCGLLLVSNQTDDVPNFKWPVNIPIRLSGTFGELRSNHFHAGIDIKSPDGGVGTPVIASADGYIHRIKIQAGGYGNAVYIKHSNGYSTVYAHLDRFRDDIEAYVLKQQLSQQKFSLSMYPGPGVFPVKQDELIAYMGNSGYSFGPHLHFEIRQNDIPENALNYLEFKDERKPLIKEVSLHSINHNQYPLSTKSYKSSELEGDTMYVDGDALTISAWLYDPHNQSKNKNGPYTYQLAVDGKIVFQSRFDAIPFDKTRYANACMNFERKTKERVTEYRLHKLPGNRFNNTISENLGVIRLGDEDLKYCEISVEDHSKNKTELKFWVRSNSQKQAEPPVFNYLLKWDEASTIQLNGLKLESPKYAFYRNAYVRILKEDKTFHIGDEGQAIHKYLQLSLPSAEKLNSKNYISYCDKDGNVSSVGGVSRKGGIDGSIRAFGEYSINIDTVPPKIKMLSWRIVDGKIKSKFRISDNVATTGRTKGLQADASYNGKWTLLKRDAKSSTVFFEKSLEKGEHIFELLVTDDRDNQTRFKKHFSY